MLSHAVQYQSHRGRFCSEQVNVCFLFFCHLNITLEGRPDLVVGHLQQVQHDFMCPHVLQQPLLLLPDSCAAHLVEPLQNLQVTEEPRKSKQVS